MFIAHISEDGRIQSCKEHSRNAAEKARNALKNIGLGNTAYLAGLLHDMGKFTSEFSDYIAKAVQGKARRGSVIHSSAGGSYLLDRFHTKSIGQIGIRDLSAEMIACAVFSHHGFVDLINEEGISGFDLRRNRQPEFDLRAKIHFFHECASETDIGILFDRSVQEISELISCFPEDASYEENCFYLGLLTRLITSAVVSGDREDTSEFMAGISPAVPEAGHIDWAKPVAALEHLIHSFPEEGRLQQARKAFSGGCNDFAKRPEGVYRLDLPTGSGKTLDALRYALRHAQLYHKQRIIYAAPLLSIIEQNAAIIRKAVGDDSMVLEHHSNLILSEDEEDIKTSELLMESWNARIIVTTMVRILEILFSGHMGDVRRMQALSDCVLILDEVQSVPPKMISLFNSAINFLSRCCHATVILCSATQPPFDLAKHRMKINPERMIDQMLLRDLSPLFKRTELVYAGSMTTEELPAYIETLQDPNGSLLIVCNTKAEAAEIFALLQQKTDRIFFLSAGMCMKHRKRVLDEIIEALHQHIPITCVSTQVIEAGIDISFDTVVRMSAGLDSIVQCAGRCNRNGEHPEPRPVQIVEHAGQKLGPLKEIIAQQNALHDLIAEYRKDAGTFENDLASDASVRYYYRSLYRNMKEDTQDYPMNHITLFDLLGQNTAFSARNKEQGKYGLNQAFRTAGGLFSVFDEDNVSVIVPYDSGADLIQELEASESQKIFSVREKLLAEAKGYAVSVTRNQLEQLRKAGLARGLYENTVFVAETECYDEQTGLLSGKMIKERSEQCSILIL